MSGESEDGTQPTYQSANQAWKWWFEWQEMVSENLQLQLQPSLLNDLQICSLQRLAQIPLLKLILFSLLLTLQQRHLALEQATQLI